MFTGKIKRGVLGTTLLGLLAAGGVGCSTNAGTGALLGGALGAGTGAIIGHNSHDRTAGGALIGGAVGALAGGAIGDAQDRADRDRDRRSDDYGYRRSDTYYERRYSEPPPPPAYYESRTYRSYGPRDESYSEYRRYDY
jgi:hypothetical protein